MSLGICARDFRNCENWHLKVFYKSAAAYPIHPRTHVVRLAMFVKKSSSQAEGFLLGDLIEPVD